MQPSNSTRSQRRSPGNDPGPPHNLPGRTISPATMAGVGIQPRPSTSSVRSAQSSTAKRSNSSSQVPLSQIEKSVTHLLVATKSLLETLTQWSKGNATDTQVSDVYVRLGYEFNMACRAFTAINVDTSDLGNVPELLRHILEATLSQEASAESLERFLPKIRDIIINLLQGLKKKQAKLRQKTSRDREGSSGAAGPSRAPSTATTGERAVSAGNSSLTSMLDEGIESGGNYSAGAAMAPRRADSGMRNQSPTRRTQRDMQETSGSQPGAMAQMPVLAARDDAPKPSAEFNIGSFPPPPPPPKQTSAFAALQRGGDLERRASRRYSQYQVSKMLGSNGVPMLPTHNGPVPNRGRKELRESMMAISSRQSQQPRPMGSVSSQTRQGSTAGYDDQGSMVVATPDKGSVTTPSHATYDSALSGPAGQAPPPHAGAGFGNARVDSPLRQQTPQAIASGTPQTAGFSASDKQDYASPAQSPPLTKDLTLFLQYKAKVKKFVLPEGFDQLSIGRLQLAFIEKFSWNTHHNGVDLPDIYIQDPVSGIRHELEDLSDIKDRTVLVLNIEPLDEVKRHIDEGFGTIRSIMQQVRENMEDQGQAIHRVSERQTEAAKEIARIASAPASMLPPETSSSGNARSSNSSLSPEAERRISVGQLKELQTLRRDLAVLRQTFSNFQSDLQSSMSTIRSKANNIKAAASKAAIPELDTSTGPVYVAEGRKKMNSDSDTLVNQVDDLQDTVEDLRKDVVHRGVRPRPTQLETVSADIVQAERELRRMEDFVKREKPVWTKIWEKELEDVCQGRDELRMMEELIIDLKDDLEKATETFGLVEQATREQMKETGGEDGVGTVVGAKILARGLSNLGGAENVNEVRDDVLGQVRALQPNHESRLEAIERAERQRKRNLETRKDNVLATEIISFVEEGKLKKSGGVEEVERARKAKDERIRREVWERQNGIISADHSDMMEDDVVAEAAESGAPGASMNDAMDDIVPE